MAKVQLVTHGSVDMGLRTHLVIPCWQWKQPEEVSLTESRLCRDPDAWHLLQQQKGIV